MTSALRPSAGPDRSDAALAGERLLRLAGPALGRRLDPGAVSPICVGFSGGSDSLALLLLAKAWAGQTGRPILVLTVDHCLQPASGAWTARAGQIASALGLSFRALPWLGPKPASGLPAAARRARHALLADAARAAGAQVLLLGHTADDLIEAELMREAGSSVGAPREWSPSPVWPEGRGVFLLRPLLGLRRAELRAMLAEAGWDWLEDPANEDMRYARARARISLTSAYPGEGRDPGAALTPAVSNKESLGPGLRRDERDWGGDSGGIISLTRSAASDPRLLAMACVCAGGTEKLPRGKRAQRLAARIGTGERFTATLAGARVEAGEAVQVMRDAGRARSELRLQPGAPAVWDGRFLVRAERRGVIVRRLQGCSTALPHGERQALRSLLPHARAALPLFQHEQGVTCPILAGSGWADAVSLTGERFAGACGRIAREHDLARGSDGGRQNGALS